MDIEAKWRKKITLPGFYLFAYSVATFIKKHTNTSNSSQHPANVLMSEPQLVIDSKQIKLKNNMIDATKSWQKRRRRGAAIPMGVLSQNALFHSRSRIVCKDPETLPALVLASILLI